MFCNLFLHPPIKVSAEVMEVMKGISTGSHGKGAVWRVPRSPHRLKDDWTACITPYRCGAYHGETPAQRRGLGHGQTMPMLREGSAGSEVAKLQAQLQDLGFNPGPIDGRFGPATEAAVLAFQQSAGLLADGIAGPRTQGALGLVIDTSLPSVLPEV